MVLFSIVKFIYSAIKMIFQKKEKPRRRRFANFKKICIWGLGEHQQAWKGISLSPACNQCRLLLVYHIIFINKNIYDRNDTINNILFINNISLFINSIMFKKINKIQIFTCNFLSNEL